MYFAAHFAMLAALALCLAGAAVSCHEAWSGRAEKVRILEKMQLGTFSLVLFASMALLYALLSRDFSLSYVARYSDSALPLFYTIAAFWAGQEGSLLFWMLLIASFGFLLARAAAYQKLSERHRLYFWLFYMMVQAFFLLMLTQMSNPFSMLANPPADGQGLNPLLRNIGMVLHPPLLFVGYAGFTIPACLALGAVLAGENKAWHEPSHNWILLSWATLTAGILLGAWWAYMELGWGGYWAWDPVENASLIPWFSATALLHTRIVEKRFDYLTRTNVFLACLTFLLCVFATYLVRSGVVQSLHAFGSGSVGAPLLFGILFVGLLLLVVLAGMPRARFAQLPPFTSRVGMIVILVWLMLALGLVVVLGTMWPVISQMWEPRPVGVTQSFYNAVCLPLFALIAMALAIVPWFGWKDGVWKPRMALVPVAAWAGVIAIGIMQGIKPYLAVTGVASAVAVIATVLALALLTGKKSLKASFLASHGTHLAFALIVLGVAISGPFQATWERAVAMNESFSAGGYTFTYKGLREIKNENLTINEADIEVVKGSKLIGTLKPQQRFYGSNDHPNSEVSTLFSLGTELYATIHDIEGGKLQPLRVSVHPMVNWIWIGSVIVCLLPLLAWRRRTTCDGGLHAE